MAYLIVSFFAAFAVAYSVYVETASLMLALVAYSGTGTIVLLTAVLMSSVLSRSAHTAHTPSLQT